MEKIEIDKIYEKIDNLNDLSFENRMTNTEYSLELAQEALSMSKQYSYPRGEAFSYHNIGKYYFNKSDLNKAQDFFNKAETLSKDNKIWDVLIKVYNSVARRYFTENDYLKTIEYLEKALKICEDIDDDFQVHVLNNIGVVLSRNNRENDALKYYIKTFERAIERNSDQLGLVATNIANSYTQLKKYDEAQKFYDEIMSGKYKLISNEVKGEINVVMAKIQFGKGNKETAIEYFEKAREYYKPEYDIYYYFEWVAEYSIFLKNLDMIDKAYVILNQAEKFIGKNSNKEVLSKYYDIFSSICEKKGEYKKSLELYKKYFGIVKELKSNKLEKLLLSYYYYFERC